MENIYSLAVFGKQINIVFFCEKYADNRTLAVQIKEKTANGGYEPFGTITVNLCNPQQTRKNCAFFDINNYHWLKDWLLMNNLARDTGIRAQSGYIEYPLYEWNLSAFNTNYISPVYSVDYLRFTKDGAAIGSLGWYYEDREGTETFSEEEAQETARHLADYEPFGRTSEEDGIVGWIVLKDDQFTNYIAFSGGRREARRIMRKHNRAFLKKGRYFSPFLKGDPRTPAPEAQDQDNSVDTDNNTDNNLPF